MLTSIKIDNYALIDHIEMTVDERFVVITGETGAGKSILLGAIALTLGSRADSGAILDKSRKCVIEVTYDIASYRLESWFAENDLDFLSRTLIRREIWADGRSRAFVNDTPVTNKILKELGARLIDIHSQHQSLLLAQTEYQTDLLDAYADNLALRERFDALFQTRTTRHDALNALMKRAKEATSNEEYLRFQLSRLEGAHLRAEEQGELEQERETLTHIEQIQSAFFRASEVISGDDNTVVSALKTLRHEMDAVAAIHKNAAEYRDRLESVTLELQDIAYSASRDGESIDGSSDRLERINNRLDEIYDLCGKYKVNTEEELLEIQKQCEADLAGIATFDEAVAEAKRALAKTEEEMHEVAATLHSRRATAAPLLQKEMAVLLTELGIKYPLFCVRITPITTFSPTGCDAIVFLFAANKNQEAGELARIASGGEMSRVMLSLKFILSKSRQLPVIIFDEIDAGVSGEVAHRMGLMMREMSTRMQVIAVTHLPQIAATAALHFKVYKEEESESTQTHIKRLSDSERTEEIASLISGEKITEEALRAARSLREAAR